jgi:hypothetical protein
LWRYTAMKGKLYIPAREAAAWRGCCRTHSRHGLWQEWDKTKYTIVSAIDRNDLRSRRPNSAVQPIWRKLPFMYRLSDPRILAELRQKSLLRWKFSSLENMLNMSEQKEIRRR